MVDLAALCIADPPDGWAALGVAVDATGTAQVASVALRFMGRDADGAGGLAAWSLRGLPAGWAGPLDGIATEVVGETTAEPVDGEVDGDEAGPSNGDPTPGPHDDGPVPGTPPHPLGAVGIDHVVVASPDVDRTVEAFVAAGCDPRRERQAGTPEAPMRQVFFRLGATIAELVGPPTARGDGPAALWGVVLTVADLDAAAERLGEGLGAVRGAVQPGRRIATVRHRHLGISVPTALMSPPDR